MSDDHPSLLEAIAITRATNRWLQRAEAAREETDQATSSRNDMHAVRHVAQTIAHDMRQPLSTITAALVGLSVQASPKQKRLVQAAEAALREIQRTISALLDYVISGAETKADQKVLSVSALLEDVRSANALLADERGVRLVCISQPLDIISDRHLLARVLHNLTVNALLHAKAKTVLLRARRRRDGCEIDVIDDGVGIDERQLPFVWQLGWRGSTAEPGSGLGLHVVQAFVLALEGEVSVQSSPGRGTRFTVWLPGPVSRAGHANVPRRARSGRALEHTVVAILEDEGSLLEALQATFSALGATVIGDTDEVAFLTNVLRLERAPDLVILDLMLSGDRTSLRCLSLLRQKFGEGLRVMILTGNPRHEALAGLVGVPVVEKPLSRSDIETIAGHLAGRFSDWESLFT